MNKSQTVLYNKQTDECKVNTFNYQTDNGVKIHLPNENKSNLQRLVSHTTRSIQFLIKQKLLSKCIVIFCVIVFVVFMSIPLKIVILGTHRKINSKFRKSSNFVRIVESAEEAIEKIESNALTIMIGGFGLCGIPENLIGALNKSSLENLTIISNTGGTSKAGVGILLHSHKVKRMISSFIGANLDFERKYLNGELELELVPQGTLAQRIRSAGAGIPAFYTRTGVDTLVQHGGQIIKYNFQTNSSSMISEPKESRIFNGLTYLMEYALFANYSFIKAWKADRSGNLIFRKTARNFNTIMAKAAKVEEIVDVGELDPNQIHLPGIYVDVLIKGAKFDKTIENLMVANSDDFGQIDPLKQRIARRAALEFRNGMYVNLGVGIPVLAASYVPKSVNVLLQGDNGILGIGPYPSNSNEVDTDLINPGSETITMVPGGSYFSSEESFDMISGGHLDLTMLGAFQVSKFGDLANWMIPGRKVSGMGGAMDLAGNHKTKVVVLMEHLTSNGDMKLLDECTFPLTASKCVDLIITEKCVFQVNPTSGLTLVEIYTGVSIDEIHNATACDFQISANLTEMGQATLN